jgi:hypothetical protein
VTARGRRHERQEAVMSRIPVRRFYSDAMSIKMDCLLRDASANDRRLDDMGWTGRRVLGFKLPHWQRRERWSDDQCIGFIESVYLGANVVQFMVNLTVDPRFDRILLDGQQRLRAIERYVAGEFAVPGEYAVPGWDGEPALWTDLTEQERSHFLRIGFPCLATAYQDDAALRDAYNRHNFCGTAHDISEMAEPGDLRSAPPGFHGA